VIKQRRLACKITRFCQVPLDRAHVVSLLRIRSPVVDLLRQGYQSSAFRETMGGSGRLRSEAWILCNGGSPRARRYRSICSNPFWLKSPPRPLIARQRRFEHRHCAPASCCRSVPQQCLPLSPCCHNHCHDGRLHGVLLWLAWLSMASAKPPLILSWPFGSEALGCCALSTPRLSIIHAPETQLEPRLMPRNRGGRPDERRRVLRGGSRVLSRLSRPISTDNFTYRSNGWPGARNKKGPTLGPLKPAPLRCELRWHQPRQILPRN